MQTIKIFFLLTSSITLFSSLAQGAGMADGPRTGGGGDLCEDRFQEVSNDLKDWMNRGGSNGLVLPSSFGIDQYSKAMLHSIGGAKVSCVGQGDPGFPVMIDGTPKVCVFKHAAPANLITCDYSKFQAMSPSDQYVLVHHEYAGLAGLELPNGDVSTYAISNQISGFLTITEVQKLAVKPPAIPSEYAGMPLSQLPNDSVIALTKEIFIPANSTRVSLNSVLCEFNQKIPSESKMCECNVEVKASGSARVLSAGRKINVKKSITKEEYIGYDYQGSENLLSVMDGAVDQIECHKGNFGITYDWAGTLTLEEFSLVLNGVATLKLAPPKSE